MILSENWFPAYILFAGIIVMLALDLLFREKARNYVVGSAFLFLLAAAGLAFTAADGYHFKNLFFFGNFFLVFTLIGLGSSIIVVFAAWKDLEDELDIGVFFSLLFLANIGGILIASSQNFIPLYIGYELVSIPSYAMVAFRKKNREAAEAGLKIFLLGALSSALIVYGIAMYYGATGSFAFLSYLESSGAVLPQGAENLQYMAIALIAAGSAFKIGLVPFHFWIPDVYSGAPISVVTFLAASSKKMAFAFVFQIFFFGMGAWHGNWAFIFATLATLSIVVGNLAAVVQTRMMRLLAYSTIAQAGYIAIGIAAYGYAGSNTSIQIDALQGIIFHIIAHVFMKSGALIAVLVIVNSYGDDKIDNFKGLFHKNPLIAGSLAISLFSLMGIPPLAGFFGKFFLFLAAVNADLVWLAIIGVLGSAVSIFYYTRIIRIMSDQPEDQVEIKTHPGLSTILIIITIFTIVLGVFGQNVASLATDIINDML